MIIRTGRAAREWQHRVAGVGVAVALAVALAGCGGGEQTPAVATADGTGGATPSSSASLVEQYVESRRKLAKCFRDQGIDVPDPDAKGQLNLDAMGGVNKADREKMKAWDKCRQLLMEVPAELDVQPDPATPLEAERRREYAKCMRENGLPDFPDPGPDGQWAQTEYGVVTTDQQAKTRRRAGQACNPVLDGKPRGNPDSTTPARG